MKAGLSIKYIIFDYVFLRQWPAINKGSNKVHIPRDKLGLVLVLFLVVIPIINKTKSSYIRTAK